MTSLIMGVVCFGFACTLNLILTFIIMSEVFKN